MTPIIVTDRLPEIGKQVLAYSTLGGWTVCKFTDRNTTYGYRYETAWFCKNGRQMSKKTVIAWCELPGKPE